MRRFVPAVVGLFVLSAVSGCGSAYSKNEAVAQDMVKALSDLADALESVKDRESAKAAAVKINEICDRLEELGKKAEKLPKLTKADNDKLEKKFEPELRKLSDRVQKAGLQAGRNSQGEPSLQKAALRMMDVGKALQKLGNK
jgi:hypothetical protein